MTPVSGSISTSAMWQPFGNVEPKVPSPFAVKGRRCASSASVSFLPFGSRELAPAVAHLRRLEPHLFGRERLAVLHELLTRDVAHRAGADHRARAAGVVADRRPAVDALAHAHALSRDVERFCDHHRESRLVTLPLRMRDRVGRHPALRVHFELDFVFRIHAGAGVLDHRRDADAAQLAVLLRGRAPLRVALPVREVERFREQARQVGVIVGGAGRRLVRKRIGRDEIPPPQLRRIDAGFRGRVVDEALDRIRDVRAGPRRGKRRSAQYWSPRDASRPYSAGIL